MLAYMPKIENHEDEGSRVRSKGRKHTDKAADLEDVVVVLLLYLAAPVPG